MKAHIALLKTVVILLIIAVFATACCDHKEEQAKRELENTLFYAEIRAKSGDPIISVNSSTALYMGRQHLNNHYTSTTGRIFDAGSEGKEQGPNIRVNAKMFYDTV